MDFYQLYKILNLSIGILILLVMVVNLFVRQNSIEFFEKLCRNRYVGVVIWALCIAWCVPHTEVIIFKFIAPYLWFIAIGVVALSFCFLDYLFARAFAGAMIISSYYLVHSAFEFYSKISILVTVVAWLIGIIGIIISAKPPYLRDFYRILAKDFRIKFYSSIILTIFSVVILTNGILEISGK